LRRRKDDLGLSDAALEEMGEFAAGQVSKYLGPAMEKSLGKLSLPIVLDCLGLSGTLYVDDRKVARYGHLWATEGRRSEAGIRREHSRISVAVMRRAGRKGGLARWAEVDPESRQHIARKLAKRRWRNTDAKRFA